MKVTLMFIAIFSLGLLIIPMIALSYDAQLSLLPQNTQSAAVSQASSSPEPVKEAIAPLTLPRTSEYLSLPNTEEEVVAQTDESAITADVVLESEYQISPNGVSSFKILDESTDEVTTVLIRDFVRGAIAAEMPVSFHPEALKAQAVAAHTFALHNHLSQLQNPNPALKGADFSADPSNMLVYITEETARAFYGEHADEYWSKICNAADSVVSYVMEYDDQPIVAAYHAISAGQTEDAANIWSGSAPYLLSADSEGDLLAPNFETTLTLTIKQVSDGIQKVYPQAKLSSKTQDWFNITARSQAGYVTAIEVGGITLHGKDIRTLFGLRSHNFNIDIDTNGNFIFNVHGYGHGVGLSQYGADFLARQGYTFDEILHNYYTDITIKQVEI